MEIYISIIILSASALASFFIFFFYHKEQSLYFSLLKMISLFEVSFIYSKFLYTEKIDGKNIINKLYLDNIIKYLSYNYLSFKFEENNKYFYSSMKTLYIFLNIFLFIETIKLIKRPFSQSKKKANLYYVISLLLIIISYILQKIIEHEQFPFFFYIVLYAIYIITAIISIVYVFIRFCLNKPLIQSAKNFFVMRHIIYIIVLSGMLVNESQEIFKFANEIIRNNIVYSLGLVMSIIKISDKLFVRDKNPKKKIKKKGVESMITSNLNVEFMCCILYGMTDIFVKNQNENSNDSINNLTNNEQKVHSIKYINTIDSKMNDIKDIKLHVSIQQLDENLLGSDNQTDNIINQDNSSTISKIKGEDALIIEYFPKIFNDLRKNDETSDDVMIKAFSPSKNKSAIDKMSESKGKSGSFFFYSHDRKFIIKTISSEERTTLLNILRDYYNYIKDHKETLITKIYGIYTVVIKNASSVNVILMQNLFGCSPIHIQRMFDLKGSSVQRKTKNVQNWRKDQVLKDLDYQWLTKVERKLINFKEDNIQEIRNILDNDIKFYKRLSLMDYSLLFIIIDFPNKIDPDYNQIIGLLDDPKYRGHVYKSDDEKYIYIIGIIDYLQKYNFKKKAEHFLKSIYNGKEKNMVSAVEPILYGDRFFEFMTKKVFVMGENQV